MSTDFAQNIQISQKQLQKPANPAKQPILRSFFYEISPTLVYTQNHFFRYARFLFKDKFLRRQIEQSKRQKISFFVALHENFRFFKKVKKSVRFCPFFGMYIIEGEKTKNVEGNDYLMYCVKKEVISGRN